MLPGRMPKILEFIIIIRRHQVHVKELSTSNKTLHWVRIKDSWTLIKHKNKIVITEYRSMCLGMKENIFQRKSLIENKWISYFF